MKQRKVPIAKITRPVITECYPRTRLFRMLDQNWKRPATWVSGPPGSGKTTLISSYIESRKLPCLWYRLDKIDVDIATFVYYMGQACKKAFPRRKKPLPLLTSEYLLGIPTFTRRFFEDLYSRLTPPYTLVFDRYETIPLESKLPEVIGIGLSEIPEGIKVILISRSHPPDVLTRIMANRLMQCIGWDELRLTLEESEGIFRLHRKGMSDRVTIDDYHYNVGGWVAGLVLMLESSKEEDITFLLSGKYNIEEIFDYFACEIVEKTDGGLQDFLMRTSFLSSTTASMAERLTGQSRSGHILSDLYRSNAFTERRHGAELTYQYHSLFRKFLQSRAECTYSHSELIGLWNKAARLLEESGNIEDAVKLYLKTSEWEGLTELIMKHARELVMQGRNQVLEEWLRHIPEEVRENHPWLLYWMGVGLLPFNQTESRKYLEKAFEVFHGERDEAGVFLAWSSIVQSLVLGFDSVTIHDKWIALLDKLVPEFGRIPRGEIETNVASSMFSALAMSKPGHPDFSTWQKRAVMLAVRSTDINLRINTFFQLVCYFQHKGDFNKAALTLEKLKVLSRSRAISPFGLIIIKTAEVMQYNFTAEHKQCLKAAEEAMNLANQTGVHTFDATIMGYIVWSSIGMQDFATARKYLEQMESFVGKFRLFDSYFYNFLKGFEALENGDLLSASGRAEQALVLDHFIGAIITKPSANFQYAQIRHELGDRKGAMKHLLFARNSFKEFKSGVFEFMCLLAEAQFALGRGEEKEALVLLRRAMAIGREHQYVHTYLWRPAVMSDLCVKALEEGIEVEYVRELIRKRSLVPKTPPVHIEDWPWAVKIHTLGRFDLMIEGKPVRSLGRVQKKPIKMLKALIALGGRAVSEAQMSGSLWPEADGDMAHQSFATTLHRLRRLLRNERAIRFQENRVTLDQRYCWVDLWALERMLGEEDAITEGDMGEVIQSFKKVIGMYRGPFLPGDGAEPWTVSKRERLRSKFLRYVERAGKYHEINGQWQEAVEYFRKALEVDDLAENLYQRLMICYARLNRRSEGLAVYDRCRRTLTSTLEIEPSPETEKIRQALLSGQC